jgi:asparagine synthase (glutamine-hydrolysing)
MCGINGIVSRNSLNKNRIQTMNDLIIHRGPDDQGIYFDKSNIVFLGMRRLSIVDVTNGSQPVYSDDKQVIIVFNGEIYNFKVLKEALIKKGITFKTNSDTEVILKLYENEGVTSFSKLDGMFAFSIYDQKINKLFLVRDYFGEKPLFYRSNDNEFIFASELKSIIGVSEQQPEISDIALNIYFKLTYIPAPYTIYRDIFKLEPNHFITVDCNSLSFNISEIKQDFKKYQILNKNEAIIKTHDLVQKSVLSRSISDVPLGTFLSGGVDSSIVSLCLAHQSASKIDTFSIGLENSLYNETDRSRKVASIINSNHNEIIINEGSLKKNIHEIILNFDEPFADSSALSSFVVSKEARKFVKVALTGDGGDEVFGGYNKYYIGKLNKIYTSLVPELMHNKILLAKDLVLRTSVDNRGKRFKLNKLLHSINYDNEFYFNIISLGFGENTLKTFLLDKLYINKPLENYKVQFKFNSNSIVDFRNIDKVISLEGDMLVKVDRTSMLSSLECRSPFLNKEIWNFTNQLPDSYLINGWDKKHILKEAFKDYFPKGFLNKTKKGFGVPIGDWLRSNLKCELLEYSDKSFIEKQGIFNISAIEEMVDKHISGNFDSTFQIWTFFCFQLWYIKHYGK